MPDLPRRVASLIVTSILAVTVMVPLTARSAVPEVAEAHQLLDVVGVSQRALDRGALTGRSTTVSLVRQPVSAELIAPSAPLPQPASAPMQATLFDLPPVVRAADPPTVTGNTVSGRATWYCCTLGWRGVAVVALPPALGGAYTPPPASRTVTVCADRCVELPVADACECHWGTTDQKVVDLSPEAWAAVSDAPTSRGVIEVTIHLGG